MRLAGQYGLLAQTQYHRVGRGSQRYSIVERCAITAARRLERAQIANLDIVAERRRQRIEDGHAALRIAVEDPCAKLLIRRVRKQPDNGDRRQGLGMQRQGCAIVFQHDDALLGKRLGDRSDALVIRFRTRRRVDERPLEQAKPEFHPQDVGDGLIDSCQIDAPVVDQRREVVSIRLTRHLHIDARRQRRQRRRLVAVRDAVNL